MWEGRQKPSHTQWGSKQGSPGCRWADGSVHSPQLRSCGWNTGMSMSTGDGARAAGPANCAGSAESSGLTEALWQPNHFVVPLHITTGSISPSAQGLGPNMCPPGQMPTARAVLLSCPGITCSAAARFVEALSSKAPQYYPWQEAHSTPVPKTADVDNLSRGPGSNLHLSYAGGPHRSGTS